jgi:hypothetical protein
MLALIAAGCTGSWSDLTSVSITELLDAATNTTLIVRVVNGTEGDVITTIRVDGVVKELPVCTTTQRTCDYLLSSCPNSVELIQEAEYNDDDVYTGGRTFEGVAGYSFVNGDFTCGGSVVYEFNDTTASALAF